MRRATTFFAVLCAAVVMWGCAEASPEEKVAKARARYSVTLNGFFVKEPPPPVIEVPEEEGMEIATEEAMAEEGVAEGEEEMDEAEAGPQGVDVLLDLIVQHDLDEALPGITVDLQMVDAERNEKGAWKIYIETAGLPEANQKQVTHVLEGIDYQEGDAFTVEIVSGIPSDLGAYREFGGAP